jgi:CBS domain-containing protein
MLIAQILAGKGRDVVTTRPDATVAEVTDAAGGLCGIISERDLACGLADHGAKLLDLRISQLMTAEVVTCSPEDGIAQLMHTMTERRFRHLPVIEDGRMIGIISIGDVVKHRLQELEAETNLLQDYIAGGA